MADASQRLTVRQERFVEAILDPTITSQTSAALRAGYGASSAHVRGSELVRNRKVTSALEIRRRERADKARGLDSLLERLSRIDPAELDELTAPQKIVMMAQVATVKEKLGSDIEDREVDPDRIRRRRAALRRALLRAYQLGVNSAQRPVIGRYVNSESSVTLDTEPPTAVDPTIIDL